MTLRCPASLTVWIDQIGDRVTKRSSDMGDTVGKEMRFALWGEVTRGRGDRDRSEWVERPARRAGKQHTEPKCVGPAECRGGPAPRGIASAASDAPTRF
jgi:hypothetical protein